MGTSVSRTLDLGLIELEAALAIQDQLASEVAKGSSPEMLLLMEHPPVYTIGSGGDESNVLDAAIAPLRINRGGDVTWHGPGQLVGYPIVNLGSRRRDLHRYLRFLEELLIHVSAGICIEAWRVPGRTGVWTEQGKLAFIGVGVRRWVTMHGFALNVSSGPAAFDLINPCGISGCPVTSLALENGPDVSIGEVKHMVAKAFWPLLEEWLPVRNVAGSG